MQRKEWWQQEEMTLPEALNFFLVMVAVSVISIIITIIGFNLGWFGNVAKVTQDEFSPHATLEEYERLKDIIAQLEKKRADIAIYKGRMEAMDHFYNGLPLPQWPREDHTQYNVWSWKIADIQEDYGWLAMKYNKQMAKFNCQFAEVGKLPKGADKPFQCRFSIYL